MEPTVCHKPDHAELTSSTRTFHHLPALISATAGASTVISMDHGSIPECDQIRINSVQAFRLISRADNRV